ncbi:hypothetical protein [Chromobacterium violaceum]|uniref:hypothetical protein n=1 Tax=Chromobacterium violaceum TaxID=536 RepID=UPI001559398F|nr:hypothetical protein [Chromobacterium violaceum]
MRAYGCPETTIGLFQMVGHRFDGYVLGGEFPESACASAAQQVSQIQQVFCAVLGALIQASIYLSFNIIYPLHGFAAEIARQHVDQLSNQLWCNGIFDYVFTCPPHGVGAYFQRGAGADFEQAACGRNDANQVYS